MGWNQWKVHAYAGKNSGVLVGVVFVKSSTEEKALVAGREALGVRGMAGKYRLLRVFPYFPWEDPVMNSYIAKADD